MHHPRSLNTAAPPASRRADHQRLACDGEGRKTLERQALVRDSEQRFDALGRVLKIEGPEWRPGQRLTTRTLPLRGQWRFAYDGADRLTSVANLLGEATTFAYDPNDNLETQTDAAGSVVRFRFDSLDRREAKVCPDGAEEIATYVLQNLPQGSPLPWREIALPFLFLKRWIWRVGL